MSQDRSRACRRGWLCNFVANSENSGPDFFWSTRWLPWGELPGAASVCGAEWTGQPSTSTHRSSLFCDTMGATFHVFQCRNKEARLLLFRDSRGSIGAFG